MLDNSGKNSLGKLLTSPGLKSSKLQRSLNTNSTISHESLSELNKENFLDKRRKQIEHKISPEIVPRPSYKEEVLQSEDNKYYPDMEADPMLPIPLSNTYYIFKGVSNSSFRLIRPSMHMLPTLPNIIEKSKMALGFYVQPFAELNPFESEIPKVDSEEILRCKKCNCYVNNKFTVNDEKIKNKRYFICSLCKYEIEIKENVPGVKQEYFYRDLSINKELVSPTIDFRLIKHTNEKIIQHYIFLIDISQPSFDLNFHQYITNLIQINLTQLILTNNYNSRIAFLTFDLYSVQFYYIKNKEVRVVEMMNTSEPFCPLPGEIIFNQINSEQEYENYFTSIEAICDKITTYATIKTNKFKNLNRDNSGSVLTSAIYSAFDLVKNITHKGTFKMMLFSSNKCGHGVLTLNEMDYNKLYSSENEINLFLPQHNFISNLSNIFIEKRITFDLFVLGYSKSQIHIPTFFDLCNKTGGNGFYYSVTENKNNFKDDIKEKYEKLHYDLHRTLIRKTFLDVQFIMKAPSEFQITSILGKGFNAPSTIHMASVNPDFNLMYELKLIGKLKGGCEYNFQFVAVYTDPNDYCRNIRTINYTLIATDQLIKFYTYLDVDCLTKLILMRELTSNLTFLNKNICCFDKMRESLINTLVQCLTVYMSEMSCVANYEQFVIPSSIKNMPVYFNSFLKKPLMRKIKNKIHPNIISYFISLVFSSPLNLLIKMLYPRLYRLDDIKENPKESLSSFIETDNTESNIGLFNENGIVLRPFLYPLTLDAIHVNMALLYDDGFFINLIIMNEVRQTFIEETFNGLSYEQLRLSKTIEELNLNQNFGYDEATEKNEDLNTRICNLIHQLRRDNNGYYQALKLTFVDDNNWENDEITSLFIEDSYREESTFIEFLCLIHQKIIKEIEKL